MSTTLRYTAGRSVFCRYSKKLSARTNGQLVGAGELERPTFRQNGVWKYLYRESLLSTLKLALIDCKASRASLVITFPLFEVLEELVIIRHQASFALQLTYQASLVSFGEIEDRDPAGSW